MGLFDSLFGRNNNRDSQQDNRPYRQSPYGNRGFDAAPPRPQNADEQAIARYRYMLQTAPPEELERAHEEAFARLTPEQRKMVLEGMSRDMPDSERRFLSDNPRDLARAATRAEMREPGYMNRQFAGVGMGGGMGMMGGMGGMIAGSMLASIAGGFIGSSIANSFFNNPINEQAFQGSPEAAAVDGGVAEFGESGFQETGLDASSDPYGDPSASEGFQETNTGGFDDFGGDFGGEF